MTLDQRQLRAFAAIVDAGSLGRAAGLVGMSQPALSRMIADMEARLGVSLFDRQTRGMALTVFGEALLPHVRMLLFEMDQAVGTLDAMRGLKRGTVRVGAVATIAHSLLPEAVDRLFARAPGLQVQIVQGVDHQLVGALLRREIDLIICGDVGRQEELLKIAECRFDDAYMAFCGAQHPLARHGQEATLEQVLPGPWIMSGPGTTPRVLFEDLVRTTGAPVPRVAVETLSPSVMVAFVSATQMLSWLPRPLFADQERAGLVRALHVPELIMPRRFFIYRRSRGLLPSPAAQLVEELPTQPLA